MNEFEIGGKKEDNSGQSYDSRKRKAVCSIQLTDKDKVRRFYSMQINDFSSVSLFGIFKKHISVKAKMTTYE